MCSQATLSVQLPSTMKQPHIFLANISSYIQDCLQVYRDHRVSLIVPLVNPPAGCNTQASDLLRRDSHHSVFEAFVGSTAKNLPAMRERPSSILKLGRSPEKGRLPTQFSGLENSMTIQSDTTEQSTHHIIAFDSTRNTLILIAVNNTQKCHFPFIVYHPHSSFPHTCISHIIILFALTS